MNEGLFDDMRNRLATGSQILCSVTRCKIVNKLIRKTRLQNANVLPVKYSLVCGNCTVDSLA